MRPARNWIGLLGSYTSDLLLQLFGAAILFVPFALGRVGVSWMRSRASGSGTAKTAGLILWLIFAPGLLALLPITLLWRHAVPLAGAEGNVLAAELIHFLNYPGAALLCGLMVLLSLYLTTTFLLATAREWFAEHFQFARNLRARWDKFRMRRQRSALLSEEAKLYASDEATSSRRAASTVAAVASAGVSAANDGANRSLLAGFFGWFSRRGRADADMSVVPHASADLDASAPVSVWQSMPRTMVDAPVAGPLSMAVAAAAPFAAQLAAAAAPLRGPDPLPDPPPDPVFAAAAAPVEDDGWLNAPERQAPTPILTNSANRVKAVAPAPAPQEIVPSTSARPQLVPRPEPVAAASAPLPASVPMPSPMADIAAQNIAFGRRADADTRSTSLPLPPKSIRGYKLPSSDLLYRSTEHATVREDELRDEARTLVEKCAEFGVAGVVEQINPGPVVTTFEFRPDAGVKYSRVTGLADDLCLAMAAESILIERMAGKSTVGIQVPNTERETIWLRDVVECPSFSQSKSRLAIALGKDINGRIVTADLASMPHVLIAGSTGSGQVRCDQRHDHERALQEHA